MNSDQKPGAAYERFKMGDMVRHDDGRRGMVERVTGKWVTVQFPDHARSSVVLSVKLVHAPRDEGKTAE